MNAAAVTGFHHVSLTVRDLAVSAAWYDRLLGLVRHNSIDGSIIRADRTGLDHAAFAVAKRADMDAWTARLDDAGVEHSSAITIPVGATVNFADPDETQLSIFWEGH